MAQVAGGQEASDGLKLVVWIDVRDSDEFEDSRSNLSNLSSAKVRHARPSPD